MWREAVGIAVASIRLAPALASATIEDASTRMLGVTHALALLGIAEPPRRVRALTGGRSSLVWEVTLSSGPYVVKRALAGGSVLARGARIAGPQPYPEDLSPRARIAREVTALRGLAGVVRVPRVIAVNLAAGVMMVEKIAGRSLAKAPTVATIRAYRRALDAVHAAGFVLNDAHPGNALVDGNDVALIDLEFAERAHDVERAEFDLAYAAQYFTAAERRVFLAGTRIDDRALAGYGPLFAYEAKRLRAA